MPAPTAELDALLQGTSRSFYLSLRLLPPATAPQIGLAYLVARAADTIADTAVCPQALRLEHLRALGAALASAAAGKSHRVGAIARDLTGAADSPAEKALVARLPELTRAHHALPPGDRERADRCLRTIISGQALDLERFGGSGAGGGSAPVALRTDEELDDYCHRVAGCVGAYWTDMHLAHLPSLSGLDAAAQSRLGVAYGKALQLTNVLRDLPRDLRRGRCYLPSARLEALGLAPADLLEPGCRERVRPLLHDLLRRTLAGYRAGMLYTLRLPDGELRLRLATVLPLLIGLATMSLLARSRQWLQPDTVLKVPRRRVYQLVRLGAARCGSRSALRGLFRRLLREARAAGC
jgi:farnesyl-diphosphate farnesyltransferase